MHLLCGHATSQQLKPDAVLLLLHITFRLRMYASKVLLTLCAGTIPTNVSTMVPVLHLEYNKFQAAPQTWYAASRPLSSKWYLHHISMQVEVVEYSHAQGSRPNTASP